ncbi:MAG: aldehyde dehydrogenase family protein [Oscillospiraceae bacterium]|nr:aldehyde dehydrogenase family protein [Oscillospiraceae bacterium]
MLTQQDIEKIVRETTMALTGQMPNIAAAPAPSASAPSYSPAPSGKQSFMFATANEAVAAAKAAQEKLVQMTLEQRGHLIAAMRAAGNANAKYLAELAHNETGYGSVEHKILKNQLASNKTPGMEDLQTQAFSGDDGLTIVEGAPFGVIGSITPSTNPTATIINNSISMITAGNSVVFNPHPAAKHASQEAMRLMNEAIVSAGGPANLITTCETPSLQSGLDIMNHPDIHILSITGGEEVVKTAMKAGKRVVAAGPGNPPVIVDDTANIPLAAKTIVEGASFDNNVLCVAEKEVFAFDNIADQLMSEMERNGAFRIYGADIDKVINTVLIKKEDKYVINRKYVGHDATLILHDSGIAYTGNPRLVIAEVDRYHPFIMVEMLMPVLGISRVRDIDEAISEAVRAERGCHHSAMIHSTNIHNMSRAAAALNTTIFVKNGPSYSGLGFGGQGYATLTIATPTGEGLTSARTFTRARRCVIKGDLRII